MKNMTQNEKEEQFKEIYVCNKDWIFRLCCGFTDNLDIRNDLFQEVMTNIWRSLESFEGRSAIKTWLYRVAVNSVLSFYHKSIKKTKAEVSFENQSIFHPTVAANQEHHVQTEDLINHLYNNIQKLLPLERTLISLHLEGLSNIEIANVCGLKEVSIRVKIHRIRKKLKILMEENNESGSH
jgi:RNA polymerase sigma-70 factor (ECF subfamily)